MIGAALRYADRGLKVLPIRERGKEPLVTHGVRDASSDASTIRGWWSRWPRANVAIAVPHSWFVLDIDPRNGGDETLACLQSERGALPLTISAATGGGGAHFLFARPAGVTLRGKIAAGVDVISHGRYFLAAPSVHPSGGSYRWTSPKGATVAHPPAWLVEMATVPETVAAPIPRRREAPAPSRIERARRYLDKCDVAISGQQGHAVTFTVAQKIARGFALDEESAYALLSSWNLRCQPPWSARDLRRKVTQAARFGRMPVGALLEATR